MDTTERLTHNTHIFTKLKIEFPYDSVILFLGIYLENMKTLIQKDASTPMFTAALFTIVKTWKQLKCPSPDEWMEKMWWAHMHVHTHTHTHTEEYYSVIKENEMMPFAATWMDLEMVVLSEISQKEKDKHRMVSLICGI